MIARALLALTCLIAGAARATPHPPPYAHVVVIVEENKNYEQILSPTAAPHIAALAATYGQATQFFGEVHPSEGNYVALLGGDTFGIHDDDAYFCKPGQVDPYCPGALKPGYVDHTVRAPHLGDQLQARGLSWKGYYEDIPAPGSLVPDGGPRSDGTMATSLYATKHSGFLNFASAQTDPKRAEHIVGFDQWAADLKADTLPNFALVIPNQCNEMHGLSTPWAGHDCDGSDEAALIRRGDDEVGKLVRQIQATKAWNSAENFAIVITFDEGADGVRAGCCGVTPGAASNYGGGHIPTVVITNHGPRGIADPTPYSHYSLLLTLEQVFGITTPLGHAGDADKGVKPMTPLFGEAR
jgi:hypothetical protein